MSDRPPDLDALVERVRATIRFYGNCSTPQDCGSDSVCRTSNHCPGHGFGIDVTALRELLSEYVPTPRHAS